MNDLVFMFSGVAVLTIVCVAAVILVYRRKIKRLLDRMNRMVTAAIDGSFCETAFDETMLSAVETRLSQYLSASAVSAKNLSEEKDKINELISDISHQTKTPISNILLYAQLLSEQSLPPESAHCVAALNAQAEKLSFLIGSLVKTSRLETGILVLNPTQTAVQRMLDAVIEQAAPIAKTKGITIHQSATNAVGRFDSKWTTEAVYNIVDNAIKYTPPGGVIQIETISYSLFCRIDVTDHGIGISEEEQAKIFGRFYRCAAVKDTEGVGIGLYLSRQIVSSEGGYIKVKSSVGTGTTFSVFLPI